MLPGVYQAKKKNGEAYYRSSITFMNKHISLGSFQTQERAHGAYLEAARLLADKNIPLEQMAYRPCLLKFEKIVSLINVRDNGIYIKTPIYLHHNYFSYYLSEKEEYPLTDGASKVIISPLEGISFIVRTHLFKIKR